MRVFNNKYREMMKLPDNKGLHVLGNNNDELDTTTLILSTGPTMNDEDNRDKA